VNVVFLGTGAFACPALESLARAHDVRLVVTQPDRPAGRGHALREPPVKELATRLGLPVVQPERINREAAVEEIHARAAEVIVVASYGQLLKERVFSIPPLGTVNIHASLLPAYRGAAPVQWAIIRGETRTGVTTFLIDAGMDTGDVLIQRELTIEPDETAEALEGRLAGLAASSILETLEGLRAGTVSPAKQPNRGASTAPVLTRDDGRIDWSAGARAIHDLVRGTSPWPGAWTRLDEERVKIHRTSRTGVGRGPIHPGEIALVETGRLLVGTGDELIELLEVQREGRPRVGGGAFLNGLRTTSRFG
jgi:methionyl-tRNA formyltransferase